MSCCCSGGEPDAEGFAAPACAGENTVGAGRWRGRIGAAAQWAGPLVVLALVPKCPACVAGYVLLFTGIGMTFAAAAAVRTGVIAVCGAVVVGLVVREAYRITRGRGIGRGHR
jgi:hypothetical protein